MTLWLVVILNQYRTQVLESLLYHILMEWVESGDLNKLKAVAKILREFNTGHGFYDLSREVIMRTQDKNICSSIQASIHSTPGAILGQLSNFYQQRIKELSTWLEDDNLQVRQFAKKTIQSLENDIEREIAKEDLERRSWGQ